MLHQTVSSETLWHQAPIGILQLSLDGGITHANPAFCQLVGYTEAQLRCLDHRVISHPDDFAAEVQLLQQMLDHGQRQQTLRKRYQRCDGSIVWTEVNLSLVDDVESGDVVLLSFITNVSDRRLMEQEVWQYREREALLSDTMPLRTTADLHVSSDYFRSFWETSTDILVEYDSELRCLSINPAGCTMLTLAPESIVGKTNQELFGEAADLLDSTIQRTFDTSEKIFVDYELPVAQGNRIFETVYTPITTPSGAVQRVIGVSRDVTEFKQQWQLLETQNQQLTETTRVKQDFIATTSHELRTPLTAVLGFSNVLLQGFFGELNAKQQDYVERIHDSGQHLLDLINDILDLSRLEAERLELDFQTVCISDICEGVMSLIQERALNQGLKLDVAIDPDIHWIVADPRRLKQMLLNLLVNAIKFTQEGTVGLKVYRQPLPVCVYTPTDVKYPSQPCDATVDMIHFLVWDTGIGIDAVNQQKLFSPFSQIDSFLARQHQGTGLGLIITRKLAELHGGSVTLESSLNQGACFTISLPFPPSCLDI